MRRCRIDAPKFFREMRNVELEDVQIFDADETFWKVDGLRLKNVCLHGGTYPFMFSKNIYVEGLESDSKYVFQYCQNVEIHHAKILTKDSFWECENVTIYDSELDGEYLTSSWRTVPLTRHVTVSLNIRLLRQTFEDILSTSRTLPADISLPTPSAPLPSTRTSVNRITV